MRDFHPAQDELASGDELMNVIANANMNHAPIVGWPGRATKQLMGGAAGWGVGQDSARLPKCPPYEAFSASGVPSFTSLARICHAPHLIRAGTCKHAMTTP
jgi:hypothetical protein